MKNIVNKYCLVIILFVLAGCASGPKKDVVKVFFPEPPVPARLQYLTFFTGEKDIAGKKSAFESFVTGARESERRLDKPYGVAIWGGKIYVADVNLGVIVFDLENKTYGMLPGAQGMGKLLQPVNIRVDRDGTKYVSDPVRGQVVVFDRNDFYVGSFGESPESWRPVDAVPYEDLLYVVDMKNAQIVVMDKRSGDIVRRIGRDGPPPELLSRPTNLAFDTEGYLWVSDAGRFQIVKYDRDGHFQGKIGDVGTASGTFARPRGIAVDRENRLYAVDAAFGNVQMFNKDGLLLLFFGVTGFAPGDLNLPSQVIVDYDHVKYFKQYADPNFAIEHLVIIANQFGHRMISIYAFGKEQGKAYPTDAELLEKLKERIDKARKDQSPEKQPEPEKEKQ
jgi:DNA-binding beta-propeller fold protein YncE